MAGKDQIDDFLDAPAQPGAQGDAIDQFLGPAPAREVGAGEMAVRTLKGAAHRGAAGALTALGGLAAGEGVLDPNALSDTLFKAADDQAAAARATDLQEGETATLGGKVSQFVTGLPAGIAEIPDILSGAGRDVTQHGGSLADAVKAEVAAAPAAVIQVAAPELGGRVGGALVRQGMKHYAAKAAGGALASAAGGPAGRAIGNLGLPDDMQQSVAPTIQDVGFGAFGGLFAARHVPAAERAKMQQGAAIGSALGGAARASGMSPQLADAIGRHGAAHAFETEPGALGGHAEGAIDRMSDVELQNLSPRYAALRKQGMAEAEVKAALKSRFGDAVAAYNPETAPGADAGAVDEALGGAGAAPAEDWAAGLGKQPNAADTLIEQLNQRAGAATSATAKKLFQQQAAAMTEAQGILRDAELAGQQGDHKTRAQLLQARAKILEKQGMDDPLGISTISRPAAGGASSAPAPTGMVPFDYQDPAAGFSVDEQGRARGQATPDTGEPDTIDSEAQGQQALAAPTARLALPHIPNWRPYREALPASVSEARPVTREGEVLPAGSPPRTAPLPDPDPVPEAARQHPAYSHAYPADFYAAAEAEGLPVSELTARTTDALTHLLELDTAHADLLGRTNLSMQELYNAAIQRVGEIYRREGAGGGKEVSPSDQAETGGVEVGDGTPEAAEAGPVAEDPLEADRAEVSGQRALDRAGRRVQVKEGIEPPPGFDVSGSVGLGGGKSLDGKSGFISRKIPPVLEVPTRSGGRVQIPVWEEIAAHENAEHPNIKGKGYDKAHDEDGNAATRKFLDRYDVDPVVYGNILRPYIKEAAVDALAHPDNVPAALDHRVYAKPWAETDNTHMLGEQHPWNKLHSGRRPVEERAAARARAIEEQGNANGNTRQPVAERPVSGQRELRNARPTAEEAQGGGPSAPEAPGRGQDEVGGENATQEGAGQRAGEHARAEAGAAPRGDGGEARGGEGTPDRRGNRNAAEAQANRAASPEVADDLAKLSDDKLRSYARGWGIKDAATRDPESIRAEIRQKRADSEKPAFQRGTSVRSGMRPAAVEKVAGAVMKLWRNAPRLRVHESFDADTVHPDIRMLDAQERAVGAEGAPKAWYHDGEMHINAAEMRDTRDIIHAVVHEALGHHGLRGFFGDAFNGVLDGVYKLNKADIEAQAAQEGLDLSKDAQRRLAAEEFIADRASEGEMGPIRSAIAWVRSWLRSNVSAFKDMKFSGDEIARNFLAPARRWVESGGARGADSERPLTGAESEEAAPAAFMRGDEPAAERDDKLRQAASSIGDAIKATAGRVFDGKQDVSQQLGRQGLRAALSNAIRADTKARFMLKGVRDYADRLLGKDPAAVRQAAQAWESGKPVTDPRLAAFFQQAQKYGDQMVDAVRATGKDMGYIDNYLPHLYKDPKRAAEVFYNYFQTRPMRGGGFTKERFHDTLDHARAKGLEPISENPVDLFLAHWSQMHKYVEMSKFKDHLDGHGLLNDEPASRYRMPPGWAKINDPLFAEKIAPDGVARDVNNHISHGLYQYAGWRGFRSAENLLLSTRLGASLFHGGMTTLDSFLSHSSIGFQRMLMGDVKGAAGAMAHAFNALPQATADFFGKGEGSKLVRQFLGVESTDPTTAMIFDKLTRGGARAFMEKTDTNDAITKFHRAMMQRNGGAAARAAFGAGVEVMTRNIAHKLVPAQKMIARTALFKLELDRYAKQLGAKPGDYSDIIGRMNPDRLDAIAAKVTDDVDDRLGQIAYDNLFWNKMVKDAAQASIQSVGWNVGSFRLMFGGMRDISKVFKPEASAIPLDKAGEITETHGPRLTSRLAYLLTMNSVVMATNGMLTYLTTGEQPTGKDWWYFRTGGKNADGSDERMTLPSYMRDEYGVLHRPVDMVQNKMHPALSMATELWKNHDYFGDEIRNPMDPWPTQAKQLLSYFAKSAEPYSLQNLQQQSGGGAGKAALPFFGVTKAPGYVNRSDFQQGVMDAAETQRTTRTPEQREHSHALSEAITAYRGGDKSVLDKLSPKDRTTVLKDSKSDIIGYHFAQQPLGAMLNLLDKASPEEIDKYKLLQVVRHKTLTPSGRAALAEMTPEERDAVHERLRRQAVVP